ncbi:hypothetical protein B0T22DRAFT_397650 [Podospora appendiculata]|uniref:Spc7 kinetochore protein domain-containing protein n=1 Tax=Podospora appendiculata TaxID=314037 RepID=A0AAE0XK33_9PEZI|nr:hypothetical protein B0T22DRAFT_397650 [Podospora appendiculata]
MSSSQGEVTLPATRRTRKSIGGRSPNKKPSDKENATVDLGAAMAADRKKSRSKSIGPGGFDILKSGNGNRRASLAVPSRPPPRSILKPTIPLLPEIPPHKPRQPSALVELGEAPGAESVPNSSDGTKVALRTEEEQQAAARERDERERLQMEKEIKEIKDRREARRKSLANRRVSFAAEATLHTFHEEYALDQSGANNPARRGSSAPAPQDPSDSDASETPSTPPEQIEDPIPESPTDQRDLHQKKRRRSSGAASLHFNNSTDDDTIASTVYDSDFENADSVAEINGEEMTDSSDDSDEDDGTMMTVEAEEMTSASIASARSGFSPDDSGSLDENLRLAARTAATQGVDEEEEEIIAGFGGWGKKRNSPERVTRQVAPEVDEITTSYSVPRSFPDDQDQGSDMEMDMEMEMEVDMDMDMEMTKAVGGILRPAVASPRKEQNENLDTDMDMDMSMDVTKALGGILSKPKPQVRRKSMRSKPQPLSEDVTTFGDQTMEFTMAVGGIQHGRVSDGSHADTEVNEDMSMELTTAVGGVLLHSLSSSSAQPGQRRTIAAETEADSETSIMDMTVAVGRILPGETAMEDYGDETMGMDMTMAVGGIIKQTSVFDSLSSSNPAVEEVEGPESAAVDAQSSPIRQRSAVADENGSPGIIEFTGHGLRRSRSPSHAAPPPALLPAIAMSSSPLKSPSPIRATAPPTIMPARAASSSPLRSPSPKRNVPPPAVVSSRAASSSPIRSPSPKRNVAIPAAMPPRAALSSSPLKSPTPKNSTVTPAVAASRTVSSSPLRSPSPQRSSAPASRTPTKATTSMIDSRSNSPVRDAGPIANITPRSPTKSRLFNLDPNTGANTPRVILTPQRRRLSGLGVDRPGLGSPRVAEIFDRRESIGDAAAEFTPYQPINIRRAVAFADPRVIEAEIDKERQDEEDRENSRRILEREADGFQDDHEATLNLKEMIQGLSPKKQPLRGRKSLHVGSAMGVLGKRPAELDEDDEGEERDGVKRLKGHQGSPVKNVRLRSPPSKAETTTGRKTRSSRMAQTDEDTTTPSTTKSPERATTPKNQGRFMNIDDDQPTNTFSFERTTSMDEFREQQDDDGERMHLQDFLNMTSIRFMELTTTKRRHTIVPSAPRNSTAGDGDEEISLEKCVIAGACTVPMLELYQHSCRELKKYISEGRRIVRDIESETFEENPPLFREYMSASPEFKILMDNQFKNVKSHARLLSKAMWYEWRMKLQDGLKEGLVKISEGMVEDDKLFRKQQELLTSVLPAMVKRFEALEREHEDLVAVAQELAECDPAELEEAREELVSLDAGIAEKSKKIAELRRHLIESESIIELSTNLKQQCLDDIKEAEKIREECRGWSSTEISALKAKVDKLEKQHGWAITGITGSMVSMTYKREIELVFDIASFQHQHPTATEVQDSSVIDLWYIAAQRERNPIPATAERDFFLQCIRDVVRGLNKRATRPTQLLGMVSAAWEQASHVAHHVRLLNLTFPTSVVRTSDTSIKVTCSLLLVPLKTRIEVSLNLQSVSAAGERVEVDVTPEARVVYGESFNVAKMTEFLAGKISGRVMGTVLDKEGNEVSQPPSWSEVVVELRRRLAVKGAKAGLSKQIEVGLAKNTVMGYVG